MSSIGDPRPLQEQAELGANAELLRIYRRLAQEQPPAALDAKIMALAAAAQPAAATPGRTRRPAAWLSIAASAVIVVLGAGLAWRMQVEQPLQQTRDVTAARTAAGGELVNAPTGQPLPVPESAPVTASAATAAAESTGGARADAELGERRSVEVASEELAATATTPAAAPAAPAAPPRAETAMAPPAIVIAPPPAAMPAPGATADAAAPAVTAKARSPLDPEVWLEHVQALLDAGHRDEAVVSLREWRLRHPRHAVPESLRPLLDPSDPAWLPAPGP